MTTTPTTLAELEQFLAALAIRTFNHPVWVTTRDGIVGQKAGTSGATSGYNARGIAWRTADGRAWCGYETRSGLRFRETFRTHKAPYELHSSRTAAEVFSALATTVQA